MHDSIWSHGINNNKEKNITLISFIFRKKAPFKLKT